MEPEQDIARRLEEAAAAVDVRLADLRSRLMLQDAVLQSTRGRVAELETRVFQLEKGCSSNLPPGKWEIIWSDEFDAPEGAPPLPHWFNGPNSGGTHRAATISDDDVYHDGQGNLVLRVRHEDGKNLCPYLTTNSTGFGKPGVGWTLFGPKSWTIDGQTIAPPRQNGIYVEWRANLSEYKSWASWFALWMHTTEGKAYTGNPQNGSEIDVMEYVPFVNPKNGNRDLMNNFNTAVYWGRAPAENSRPNPRRTSAATFGVNLEDDAFHTWGLEWYSDHQVYWFDGNTYWTNVNGVSTAGNHGIRMTVEVQDNAFGLPSGTLADNPPERLPGHVLVDYVRVYRRIGGVG